MRIFVKAMVIVLMATPAYSQGMNMNLLGGPGKMKTMEEVQQEAERDSAYQSAIKKLPNQNTKKDPWGNIRGGAAQSSQTQSHSGTR
jgi:hypothetical protein